VVVLVVLVVLVVMMVVVVKRTVVVEKNVLVAFANNFRGEIAARRSDKRRKC